MAATFFLAGLLAFGISLAQASRDAAYLIQQSAALQALLDEKQLLSQSGFALAFLLFCNNFRAAGMMVLIGAVPFCYLSVGALLLNGALLGLLGAILQGKGLGLSTFVLGIFPHGMLEIPALLVAAMLGCLFCQRLSQAIYSALRGTTLDGEGLVALVIEELRCFVWVVVPLLAIAALIETFVTPFLLR